MDSTECSHISKMTEMVKSIFTGMAIMYASKVYPLTGYIPMTITSVHTEMAITCARYIRWHNIK